MDSLSLRKANKKAILESISRRHAQLPAHGKVSYAGIVKSNQHTTTRLAAGLTQQPNQAINPNHPLEIQALTDLPTANHTADRSNEEEGWTLVKRRKHHSLEKKSHIVPKLSKYIELLRAQGRCYICLDWGHTQFQCRNGVRCNKCHGVGHIARACTTKGNFPTNTPSIPKLRTTVRTNSQPIAQTAQPTMDLDNWETMPMLSPNLIIPTPPPEPRVFFPPNDDLHPPNTLLHRSAIVLLGSKTNISYMPQRIANAIAATFECHPADFKVSPLHPTIGNFLVEFSSNVLRNMAAAISVFMIARGLKVQLREWTPNLGMVREILWTPVSC